MTSATTLTARMVLTPDGWVADAAVDIDAGRIVGCRPTDVPPAWDHLVPGFVDLQCNGMDDLDCATSDDAGWERLGAIVLATGVTTWCPTLVTAPLDRLAAAVGRIERARETGAGASIAGVHLEGPFLGAVPGAHRAEWIRPIDLGWILGLGPVVRIVTIGAEQDDAVTATTALATAGTVVSIGHSAASFERVEEAADAGATLVTHLFNGMPPFHHRRPGLVGAALSDPRLTTSLIADLVHVHPAGIRMAFASKGAGRIALITDAVAWRSMRAEVRDGAPRLADGTLAGTCLTMDAAVRNVVGIGVPLADAVTAAATTPARILGLDDRGVLAPGRRADLVALDVDLRVVGVWIEGRPATSREHSGE